MTVSLILGWVGLGQSADAFGWVGSHKMDPWTTLDQPVKRGCCQSEYSLDTCFLIDWPGWRLHAGSRQWETQIWRWTACRGVFSKSAAWAELNMLITARRTKTPRNNAKCNVKCHRKQFLQASGRDSPSLLRLYTFGSSSKLYHTHFPITLLRVPRLLRLAATAPLCPIINNHQSCILEWSK